jgi:cytochrome c553
LRSILPRKQTRVPNKMNRVQFALAATFLSVIPSLAFSAGNAADGLNKSAVCHACHGPTGKSIQPIYPNLGGQHQDYLSKTLREFRSGGRKNAIMSGFAANLSDTDIEDISAWYASQQGLTEIKDK